MYGFNLNSSRNYFDHSSELNLQKNIFPKITKKTIFGSIQHRQNQQDCEKNKGNCTNQKEVFVLQSTYVQNPKVIKKVNSYKMKIYILSFISGFY